MHGFASTLIGELSPTHLLKHPFYQSWSAGELSREDLKLYARQYFHHEAAFPRCVSAVHSACESLEMRQLLVENLVDEERGPDNHPELWLRFADALGEDRDAVRKEALLPKTHALVETYRALTRGSYAQGVGALFAYEQQMPEVAATKIEGLKKFYGVSGERGLSFFTAHLEADAKHSAWEARMLDALDSSGEEQARAGALAASLALWGFLDGVSLAAGRA